MGFLKGVPEVTNTSFYRGYKINVVKDVPCYKDILDNSIEQLEIMLTYYDPVFTFRFDLHLPKAPLFVVGGNPNYQKEATIKIGKFFKKLTNKLKAKRTNDNSYNNHKQVAFQWVFEVEKEKQGHFHCWIAVANRKINKTGVIGNTIEESSGLHGLMQRLWTELTGGTYYAVNNPRKLVRKDNIKLKDAIYHYSYLAKKRGKGYENEKRKGCKNHGSSRLKKNTLTLNTNLS
jgi:hypothetical protein